MNKFIMSTAATHDNRNVARVKELLAAGYTQRVVAARTGYSASYISHIETRFRIVTSDPNRIRNMKDVIRDAREALANSGREKKGIHD